MTVEINFYQVDETIIKALAPLMLKVLEENKKALIFAQDANQIKELDNSLWSYGRNKFIPHITINDSEFDLKRQPILLTNKQENANNANYLVFFDKPEIDFINNFERCFFFFEEGNIAFAKELASKVKPTNCYKKTAGKWSKFTL